LLEGHLLVFLIGLVRRVQIGGKIESGKKRDNIVDLDEH